MTKSQRGITAVILSISLFAIASLVQSRRVTPVDGLRCVDGSLIEFVDGTPVRRAMDAGSPVRCTAPN